MKDGPSLEYLGRFRAPRLCDHWDVIPVIGQTDSVIEDRQAAERDSSFLSFFNSRFLVVSNLPCNWRPEAICRVVECFRGDDGIPTLNYCSFNQLVHRLPKARKWLDHPYRRQYELLMEYRPHG